MVNMKTTVLERPKPDYGDETEFLTRDQLMKLLKISKWRITQAMKDPADPMPHIQRGRTLRFPKRACIAWFQGGAVA